MKNNFEVTAVGSLRVGKGRTAMMRLTHGHRLARASADQLGGYMASSVIFRSVLTALVLGAFAIPAGAQSFRVQCPTSTITHPNGTTVDPAHPGQVKCQQIAGGDGYATMGDGTQTYLFSFGPLSGLAHIANGLPGTEFPDIFNGTYPGTLVPGDPATTDGVAANTWPADITGFPL